MVKPPLNGPFLAPLMWGANDLGQLGTGDCEPRACPTKIGARVKTKSFPGGFLVAHVDIWHYYIILYNIILYYHILYYIILYYFILYCIIHIIFMFLYILLLYIVLLYIIYCNTLYILLDCHIIIFDLYYRLLYSYFIIFCFISLY